MLRSTKLPNGYRQLESARPRAARIEVKYSVSSLLLRRVAVAGDYDSETGGLRFEIELGQIM